MTVTPASVAVIAGVAAPSDAVVDRWQYWIDAALLLIRSRLGDTSLLDQDVLDYVVGEAVAAMVKRPEDYTQVDVQIDDGRVSKRYESSKGRVVILDEWWNLLAPTSRRGRAFSIDSLPYC